MKKLFLLLFFLPTIVFASNIECDAGNKKINDEFNCKVTGKANTNYEYIKGSITTPKYIECNEITLNEGLAEISPYQNNEFNIKGISSTDALFNIKCRVKENVSDSINGTIVISNFSYNGITEVLRSNPFTLIPVNNQIQEKPKNTSNYNLLISEITDPNLDFVFSRFITDYNIEVLYEVSEINPSITLVHPKSTYEISTKKLNVGNNVIDIVVTGPDGEKNTYTLNIKRLKEGKQKYIKENDVSLKNIEIKGTDFKFSADKKEYKLKLKGEISSLDIDVAPNYKNETINIVGNSNIQNNSKIIIEVTSENKQNKDEYTIIIEKEFDLKEDANYIWLIVIASLVTILLIIILITNNRRYKKKSSVLDKIEIIDNK